MEAKVLHKKKAIAPKLRFKGFVEGWTKTQLNDIAEKVNSGKTPLGGNSVYVYEGILFIRSQNVLDNKLSYENSTFISKEINDAMKNSIVKANDILLNITGASLGRSCVVPKEFTVGNVNQHVCIIRLTKENNPYFFQPIFASEKGQKLFTSLQTGSGREGLNFQSIKKITLAIPTLPEQQKIASFLSSVDEKIQQLTRKKELLEHYKKGVMQQLFSGKLRFKDENGKAFPNWEEKRLMDVVEPERKIRYGVVQPGEFDENGRLLVRGQDYSQGWANVNSLFRVSNEVEKKYSKARLKYQDLVITIVGAGTGFVAQVPIEFDDANITQTTARIAIDKTKGDPYYFLGYLRSSFGRKLIYSFIKGAAQPGLNVGDVEIFKVKVPLRAEQKKIANYLSKIDNKIESVKKQITQTQTFKKGLLQQMFV